ncbi:MAG: hypothetical protein LM589_01670 [Thermosphaera sp.]|nr:hypothetical protein [Thermosphaera sp.]
MAIGIVGGRGTGKAVFVSLFVIALLVLALLWFAVLRALRKHLLRVVE